MKKHLAVSLSVLAFASFSSAYSALQAADVSAEIGSNAGVQTGPTAGAVGGDRGVHVSTPTGTTGVNTSEPTGVGVNSGVSGLPDAATTTDTDVNAPANTMARITAHLSGEGYTNVQRFNDAQASTNNNLAFTAKNKAGQSVVVTVDSETGAVLSEKPHP